MPYRDTCLLHLLHERTTVIIKGRKRQQSQGGACRHGNMPSRFLLHISPTDQ